MASVQILLRFVPLILVLQALPQSSPPNAEPPRIHLNQDQLTCIATNLVEPVYPRQARLAHTEGVVKVVWIVAPGGSVDLQPVSGDSLLLDSAMKAVRQWRLLIGGVVGQPREIEVPLSFTFKIEDPPKPAYLYLANGEVIRADAVREFTDRIEYIVGGRIHRITPNSLTRITACRVVLRPVLKEGECLPSGRPTFNVVAIPLLPSDKK